MRFDRRTAVCLAVLAAAAPVATADEAIRAHLAARGTPPVEYVVAKAETHAVVVIGEAHWLRSDAELMRDLVPALAARGIALAVEHLLAREQPALDRLLGAPEWDPAAAMRILRVSGFPYREYLDVLRAAWEASRKGRRFRLVGVQGVPDGSYDRLMADTVADLVEKERTRVVLFCGLHHAFTRYLQPELDLQGRVLRFMDRAGNMLWRRFGTRVWLVTLHRPLWCGEVEPWTYCLPLEGALDCAAAGGTGRPLGFDVAGTPLGERKLDARLYYARGHPSLRLGDMTDGYVWSRPLEEHQAVTLIPLDELAPDEAALVELAANNPFSDRKGMTRAELAALWDDRRAGAADLLKARGWAGLRGWRAGCAAPQ